MSKRVTLDPGWGAWADDLHVEVQRVDGPALFNTYEVFADGETVGYVVSRKSGRETGWDHSPTKPDGNADFMFTAPDRRQAVSNLLFERNRP